MTLEAYSNTILINAKSVHPSHGSEFGFSWQWIITLAQRGYQLEVITAIHQDNQEVILDYLKQHDIQNINFHFVQYRDVLSFVPIRQVKLYVKYWLWHYHAYQKAKEICKAKPVALVHQLNTIGFRLPGFQFLLKKPMVWGPIGGGQPYHLPLFSHLTFKGKIAKGVYNIINAIQWKFAPYINYCFRRADVILCSTQEIQEMVEKKTFVAKAKVFHIPETACIAKDIGTQKELNTNEEIVISYACLLHHGKNLPFIFDALARMKGENIRFELCGEGPLEKEYKAMAAKKGLDNIVWHGWLSKEETREVIKKSDIFVMSSIREANSNVIFEALATATPVISIALSGMKDTIVHGVNGYLIPMKKRDEMIEELVSILRQLMTNKQKLKELSDGAYTSAKVHTYSHRIDELQPIYFKAIQSYYGID